MPVVDATDAALEGYGRLVADPDDCPIEIVRWPARGTRPVDEDTGDQAGTTRGIFVSEWAGDVLYGRNEAVDGHYVLAYATEPADADAAHDRDPRPPCCCGTRTTTRTAASCSSRSTRSITTCRSRCRATT